MQHGERDVIIAGDLYVDLILSGLDSWPEPGKEVFATGMRREIGAGTSITSCGLAKLGISTEVFAIVGHDSGAWVIEQLERSQVRTHSIEFHATEPTGLSVAATTPRDRAFLSYPGANRAFESRFLHLVSTGKFKNAKHLHLAYAPDLRYAAELFEELRSGGATVSLDIGWHENWLSDRRALDALSKLDLFFPNEVEARLLTLESDPIKMLYALRDAGVRRVALKLGADGAALLYDGEIILSAAFPVTAVDTTGAGDCFDAGFLYAWLKGEEPGMCLRTATICAGLSTEAYGGIAGFPALERLAAELAKGF